MTDGTVPGLTIGASKTGCATWYMRFWFNGKQKEVTIGRYPDVALSAARANARELRKEIERGVDIALDKRARKAKAKAEALAMAVDRAMLSQVVDWLSTWWAVASDADRAELFKDWQQTVSTIPGASKWPG